jgi:hypothetical protein
MSSEFIGRDDADKNGRSRTLDWLIFHKSNVFLMGKKGLESTSFKIPDVNQ